MVYKINCDPVVTGYLRQIIASNKHKIKFSFSTPYTFAHFDKLKVPTTDKAHGIAKNTIISLTDTKKDPLITKSIEHLGVSNCTNAIVYSSMSIMPWHTNSDIPGERLYYTYSQKKSVFRYLDPEDEKIKDDYDNIGWTARKFIIGDNNLLWHAVWSEGIRFSFGFNTV
jgi:hypothetical protein